MNKELESIKSKLLKIKKRLIKLISFKGRYKHGNYLFVKCSQWFGIVKHRVSCPNFKYHNESIIIFGWMITNVTKNKP